MTQPGDPSHHFDPEAVHAKYKDEREKRMVAGRADIRDLRGDELFKQYTADPFTPFAERDAVADEVDVVIIGAGMSGLVAGAKLREVGVERIRLIDQAGGVGGTWYWNRYPGVMCDVESYVYMPMLEELNYVPRTRYAFGEEIRGHFEAIAEKYDLVRDALFHTGVVKSEWNESISRWFGLTFEMPVLLTLLAKVGIISSKGLKRFRRYAYVGMFVIAAILAPPDVITQTGLAIPLIALYEISILAAKMVEPKPVEV